MVIKQEKSINWLVFCKRGASKIGKHEKPENIFLSISPAPRLPTNSLSCFLMINIYILLRWPTFFRACTTFGRFHSFSQMPIWSLVVIETHEYAEMIHLLGIHQTWMLFRDQNKNQLTKETNNFVSSVRSTAMWLWSNRRLNIEQCVFVSQIHPRNPSTDSNRLIKFSQRFLLDKFKIENLNAMALKAEKFN